MAYTPTNWTTGDTITAVKLNKMEQGIADSGGGGGGTVFYEVTTTNFPSSTNQIAHTGYVKKVGSSYTVAQRITSYNDGISVYGNTTACEFLQCIVPTLENYYLALFPASGVTVTNSSGNIESTLITVSGMGNGYIITGDFTIACSGWA